MEREMSTADFRYQFDDMINEYRTMRISAEGEELERIDEMIEACKTLDGKSLEEVLNLVDTGAFNEIITAFCLRAMRDAGVEGDKIEKTLENLESLFEEVAENVVVEELKVEVTEEE